MIQAITVLVELDPTYPQKPSQRPIDRVLIEHLADSLNYVDGVIRVIDVSIDGTPLDLQESQR